MTAALPLMDWPPPEPKPIDPEMSFSAVATAEKELPSGSQVLVSLCGGYQSDVHLDGCVFITDEPECFYLFYPVHWGESVSCSDHVRQCTTVVWRINRSLPQQGGEKSLRRVSFSANKSYALCVGFVW